MDFGTVLKELSTYPAVSGSEQALSAYIKALFGRYCDTVEVDRFYNVIGIKKGTGVNRKRIMVTAHMDEIGLLVNGIDDHGFIKFSNIGGVDSKILLAQEVVIHGKRNIPGVIGAKPPHLLKPDEAKKAVKIGDLTIDTGMPTDEVKKQISIGDVITFKAQPLDLQGNKVSSKSIDNRCGVAALVLIMEELAALKHASDIYFVATTQEEVELTGVTVAAYNINPEMAVVIDACHGDMPDAPKDETYALRKGPAIGIGPNLHKKMTRKAIDIAKEENIPYQIDIEPDDTGTEAWATQVSRAGIPTVLISIPVRYMHTPIETVSKEDIKYTAKLAAKLLSRPSPEMEEILCY